MTELLTVNELAEHLRLSPDTIRLWTRQGIIPAIRINRKVVRYDVADVECALRERSAQQQKRGATT